MSDALTAVSEFFEEYRRLVRLAYLEGRARAYEAMGGDRDDLD